MNLSIRELRESLKSLGTMGTAGTINKDESLMCPQSENGSGDNGGKVLFGRGLHPVLSPPSPPPQNEWGHEAINDCGLVPVVPTVPDEKSESRNDKPVLVQVPAYWEEDFSRWALSECLFADGCLWRVEAMHEHFCEWCNSQEEVPCMLSTFAALLEEEGFTTTAGLVQGLVLREEYLALTAPERKAKAAPGKKCELRENGSK